MLLRTATPDDHAAIFRVTCLAFEAGSEPYLVEHLRATPGVFDPELEVVAEDDGQVVGHVLFTWVELTDEEGTVHRVLQLAPLAVHPRWQSTGIGGDLVREGLRRAEAAGSPLVMIMGHPTYYPRFGFLVAGDHGITFDPEGASPAFMVHPLSAETPVLRGSVRLGPGFDTGASGWPPQIEPAVMDAIRAERAAIRERGGSAGDLARHIEAAHGWPARTGYLMLIDDTVAWEHAWNVMADGSIVESWSDAFGDAFPGDVLAVKHDDPLRHRYRDEPEGSVTVVFTKYDGSLHWHFTGPRLGEDEHGVWVGCRAGMVIQRGHEPHRIETNPFVGVIPHEGGWMSVWNAEPRDPDVYVDITSVPRWEGSRVHLIDIDLDVIRRRDGTVFVDDEDEFAEHQVRWSYPAEVIADAEATCARLVQMVTDRIEPFGEVGPSWLANLQAMATRHA